MQRLRSHGNKGEEMIEVNQATIYHYIYPNRGYYMKKVCTGCKVEKFFDEFGKDKKAFDGLNQKCKDCCKARAKISVRSESALKKSRIYRLQWQKERRPMLNERCKQYYLNNIEKRREYLKIKQKEYLQTQKGKLAHKNNSKEFREKNPEKIEAQQSTRRAIKKGLLIRPKICSKCQKNCKPHAHHEDYSKHLDIIWLCNDCHYNHHHGNKFRAERLNETASEKEDVIV